MEKILHPAATRKTAYYSWLRGKYSVNIQYYFDLNSRQREALRMLNDAITNTFINLLTPRDTLGIWSTKNVSPTTENDIHVLHIEIPIQ
jgi:hypothetical protein